MATFLYNFGREGFLSGGADWDTDTFKCFFIDAADYTVSQSADQYLSDITSGARVGTATTLTSPTVTNGVADAADVTITSVTGDVSAAIVIYKHTGVEGTSRLIAYIDNYSGLPVTPNGGNITISWPNDANKIFKL